MHDIDNLPLIELGHQTENDVCEIQFDVTDWLADYPEGVFTITYIRPTETAVYPVAAGDLAVSTVDNAEVLTWTVSDAVTAIAGSGSIVVKLTEGDKVKTTGTVQTITLEGHAATTDPPSPMQAWWDAMDARVTALEEGVE